MRNGYLLGCSRIRAVGMSVIRPSVPTRQATTNVNTCEGPPLGIRKAEQNVGVENDPLDPGAHARCRRVARAALISASISFADSVDRT